MDIPHGPAAVTFLKQGIVFTACFEAVRFVHRPGKINREAIVHMDGVGGTVFQAIDHLDFRVREFHLDIQVLTDHLHLRDLERHRVAGADAGGIGNDRVAVREQQARKCQQKDQGEKLFFHEIRGFQCIERSGRGLRPEKIRCGSSMARMMPRTMATAALTAPKPLSRAIGNCAETR